jgi:hypothetical protein
MSHDRRVDHADAVAFADGWVKAWNSHDLEKVLSHFADNVVFTSPVAAQFLDDSDGVIRGRLRCGRTGPRDFDASPTCTSRWWVSTSA